MSLAYATAAQRFDAARQAYQAGRAADAVRLLDAVLLAEPRSGPAHHLMGLSLTALRRFEPAEKAIRASLAADKRRPAVHVALAEVLQQTGRAGEAEKAYRAALALDRRHPGAAAGLAGLLIALQRPHEALQVTTPLAVAADAPATVLDPHAEALKRLGRLEEALEVNRRAVAAGGPFSALELAGTLRELGRYQEAEAAARRAFETAGDHPAAWSVLGRVLQDLGRMDEADAAYRKALALAPFDPFSHQALADLIWIRTGDAERAATPLDSVLRQRATAPLVALRAKLHTRAGQPEAAFALLEQASRSVPDDPLIHAAAATAAVHAGQVEAGLAHAERAQALAPDVPKIQALLAETSLAAGRPERAAEIVAGLRRLNPDDQQYIALQALAWRLMGDPRAQAFEDYEALVGVFTLPTPPGWPDLPAFLADLGRTLKAMHAARADPLDQSLRHGTQTEQNLALSADPVLRAFFQAAQGPVGDYVARVGRGSDPLRARNTGRWRVKSAWSVKLDPNGFHLDHLHPDGWLSSAFYVELPPAMREEGRQGWLKFGQPPMLTRPPLEPACYVKPEPGRLVLFPSYMWHGTVAFGGDAPRLTLAFDVVPAGER